MTANQTRWFEYGEPIGNYRVEAFIRTTYQTGPNEPPKKDDVVSGTIEYVALEMLSNNDEIRQHTHEDGSVMLSGLSDEVEERLLDTFEES